MRNFQTLDQVHIDAGTGVITLSTQDENGMRPRVSMRREGGYVSISASYGPLEIAMRPRFVELGRTLSRLRPVQGLQTTRQVGTGQAYIALGLQEDGALILRPTIVADATGHFCINLTLTNDVRQRVFDWLPISEAENAPDV
ncbi:MAG: hypothetical protein H7Y09_00795 [Chitinophagaceae bacterium]|nr:hypothetical protein [Anaerolineae bacterium]